MPPKRQAAIANANGPGCGTIHWLFPGVLSDRNNQKALIANRHPVARINGIRDLRPSPLSVPTADEMAAIAICKKIASSIWAPNRRGRLKAIKPPNCARSRLQTQVQRSEWNQVVATDRAQAPQSIATGTIRSPKPTGFHGLESK